MSDRSTTSHEHADDNYHEANHEGPIRTPKQLVIAVIFAFVVPIGIIALLVNYVASANKPAAGSSLSDAQVAARIKPVGAVAVKDASDPAALKTGEQVYAAQCVACHGAGVAGAPKFGDAAAWGPRVKQGYDVLLTSALKGKGAMGPQGGGDFSDVEIGRAVVHMANAGGAKFEEPKGAAPASAAPTAAAPAAEPSPAAADAAAKVAAANQAATVAPAGPGAPAAQGDAVPALYTQVCQACHAAGVANAPKVGDKAAWASRTGQGVDGLTASVIKGKGAMPPKGGAGNASDADIKAVVTYMVNASK